MIDPEERQIQIERDLARFYARNPGTPQDAAPPVGRSPLDMGTIPWEEAFKGLDIKTVGDLDFLNEMVPALRKRLVWDIVPDEQVVAFQRGLGTIPGSEEGNVIEEADSQTRRNRLLPLMPLVTVAAMTAGEIVSRAKMMDSGDSVEEGSLMTLTPEHNVIPEVANGVMAVIANLLDLGLLKYGDGVV